MDNLNTKIWDAAEKTDPAFTKKFNRAGFKGDAINPCYIVKRLTEMFGPCGFGWRFVLEHERYIEGKTLSNGDKAICHVVRGHLEYIVGDSNEWHATGPQYGQTFFVGEHANAGVYCDEEAPKKSITDCMGKCAVLLGFGADIHLGLWDASKYVNQVEGRQPTIDSQQKHPSGPTAGEPAAASQVDQLHSSSDAPQQLQVGLPPNFDKWFAEQWAEYFSQNAPSVATLMKIYSLACSLSELYRGQHWPEFCQSVADYFKKIDTKEKLTERKQLIACLKAEESWLKSNKGKSGTTAAKGA